MTDKPSLSLNDESDFEELLHPQKFHVAEPDQDLLDRIRELTMQEFESISASQESPSSKSGESPDSESLSVTISPIDPYQKTSHPMKTSALVTALALVLSVCWFVIVPNTQASTLKLGDVLAKLEEVETLQLQVTRDGASSDVWVKNSGIVRWEVSPQKYQIARGSKLWEVSEADSGEATVADPVQNPWRSQSGYIDLVALLGIQSSTQDEFLEATADGVANYSGVDCFVFRELVKTGDQQLRLNFYVNQKTNELLAITARPKGARRTGPPLAELSLIARNLPVDEAKFRVPVKLAEADRIGKVSDSQGIVTLRPTGAKRWTPITGQILLQVGDWIRTDAHGANAVTLELAAGIKLIAGPHSLVEVISADEVRLHSGTAQVSRSKSAPNDFLLRGLGDDFQMIQKPGSQIVRIDNDRKLSEIANKPTWLKGYDGSTSEDSIGSLIVEIDGRATPLTIGEHHVTIEIRDQIARTTIEETFVNHTDSRMEGQFHFPLPQDASISGFGMWIGGELIEADIVEKQRAREIYETILREKRDPGLLEWTGGNIFKARVFPIEPNSEKRVKIVYTQVLPLQGNRFRYSYGLKSEMLQTNPLRELNIRCLINSTIPLSAVESPTHTCRTQLTDHSAELEFVAQEYSPTKDFEVVCDVSQRENDVVLIPHQRGGDGYFLFELMPPAESGDWKRQTVLDGSPLELILLCDTSGSMDSSMRKAQQEFVATLLGSLSDDDRVAVATTDVSTDWLVEKFSAPTEKRIAAIRENLENRVSLGWTDLDQAFSAVMKKATSKTQVIYIGDGIVTTTQSDPAAFVNRLKRRFEEARTQSGTAPGFHAVSVGSTSESVVLKGISSLGKGSMRQVSGEITPQLAALNLLKEITSPGLKDVQVEFQGIEVAAVYPEELPNIPVGTQQILVGRYRPTGENQTGKVVVTGMLDGKPVKYVAHVNLSEAESGNSFIPRLWARGHLDQLMQQGSNQKIQDQIIALSEEFHIITPYTSLLVLESDADRERFGVKRRFGMRDGEQFFADGRSNATYELKQQQMQNAGNWRLGLRRQILGEIAGMGRDPRVFQSFNDFAPRGSRVAKDKLQLGVTPRIIIGEEEAPIISDGTSLNFSGRAGRYYLGDDVQHYPVSGMQPDTYSFYVQVGRGGQAQESRDVNLWFEDVQATKEFRRDFDADKRQTYGEPFNQRGGFGGRPGLSTLGFDISDMALKREEKSLQQFGAYQEREQDFFYESAFSSIYRTNNGPFSGSEGFLGGSRSQLKDWDTALRDRQRNESISISGELFSRLPSLNTSLRRSGDKSAWGFRTSASVSGSLNWVNQLFPALVMPTPKSEAATPEESLWSPEAIELAKSLLVKNELESIREGGIFIEREMTVWSDDFDRLVPSHRRTEVWSPSKWVTVDHSQGQNSIVNWRDKEQRGVYSESFLLGQVRDLIEDETNPNPLNLQGHSLSSLHESMSGYLATIEKVDEGHSVLVLKSPTKATGFRFEIDTQRRVITKQERLTNGQVTSTVLYEDFVAALNCWWPTKVTTNVTTTSAQRQENPSFVVTQKIRELTPQDFSAQWEQQLSRQTESLILSLPLPELAVARKTVRGDDATVDDHLVMLVRYCHFGAWKDAFEQLRKMEALGTEKPGMQYLRIAVELAAGRKEDARQKIVKRIDTFVDGTGEGNPASQRGDLFLATHLLSSVYSIIGWPEYAPVVEKLKPIYDRQADTEVAQLDWENRWVQVLNALGKTEENLQLQKEMTQKYPGNVSVQIRYGSTLIQHQRRDEAKKFFKQQMNLENHWSHNELTRLRDRYAEMLEGNSEYEELLAFLQDWLKKETDSSRVFSRLLSALIMNDQITEAEDLVTAWLQLAQQPAELDVVASSKVDAAIQFAFGSGHNLNRYNGMDRKWLPELFKTAIACIQNEERLQIARNIVSNNNFVQSDEGDRLRGSILNWLLDEAGSLPYERLSLSLETLKRGRLLIEEGEAMEIRQVTENEWKIIADQLLKRWEQEEELQAKHQFSQLLVPIYSSYLSTEHLPFLRRLVKEGSEEYRRNYREQLFSVLLSQSWSESIESEAFELWLSLSGSVSPSQRAFYLAPKLYQLIDKMAQNRVIARVVELQNEGKSDELTRTEMAEKQAAFVESAREALAERLVKTSEQIADSHPELLPWLQLERIRLDVELGQNRQQSIKECWELIGDELPALDLETELTAEEFSQEILNGHIRERALMTVINFAARKEASEQEIERVLEYVDQAIQQTTEDAETLQKSFGKEGEIYQKEDFSKPWKSLKYKLLILFDRPDELRKQLRKWIDNDEWNTSWQRGLALLLAEQGELEEAIKIFETIQEKKELTSDDYKALANWQLVLDRKEDHEASRLKVLFEQSEWNMANLLNQQARQIGSGSGPHELDENSLLILKALFEKTSQPGNHYSTIRNLYTATRDFRVFEQVPEGMLGRTQSMTYNALQQFHNTILREVRKEATADKMLEHVEKLRDRLNAGEVPRGADPNVRSLGLDLRALDLIEAMIEVRSSQVLNEPGPHAQKAVAALNRAFKRDWQEGEPYRYAQFLQQLGGLTNSTNAVVLQPLVDVQLSQLKQLYESAKTGSTERVRIAVARATLLMNSYRRHDEAIRLIEISLDEFAEPHGGLIPYSSRDLVMTYSSFLQKRAAYAKAEKYVLKHRDALQNESQRWAYEQHLNRLYEQAFRHDARVSLGEGATLFENLIARLVQQSTTQNDSQKYNILMQVGNLFSFVLGDQTKGPEDEQEQFLKFTSQTFPEILPPQEQYYSSLISHFSSLLNSHVSPLEALNFVIDRYEEYPVRLRYSSQNQWVNHASQLAQYRHNAANDQATDKTRLNQLEGRLLLIVVNELRDELLSLQVRNQQIYHDDYSYFWSEKAEDFQRVAETVLEERADSPRIIFYVANYLNNGLSLHSRAIEILMDAKRRGLLDDSGTRTLVRFLHAQKMYLKSIPLLTELIENSPRDMSLRVLLLRSYHYTAKTDEVQTLLTETDALFHADNLWTEANIIQLARVCVEIGHLQEGIGYLEEAINLHQRTAPNRGVGDGVLSEYYAELGAAYGRAGNTEKAVDAAAAAIVSWGPRHDQRRYAVDNLNAVIASARDIDDYIQLLNTKAKRTGEDSPIIRKAIGMRFFKEKKYKAAIEQFQLANELSPYDREVHEGLLNSFDKLNDSQGAIKQLLGQIDFDRHHLQLYVDLANRVKVDPNLAERAATSIVESAPNEAESHEELAKFRESQSRWESAISHWERVAELRKLEPTGLLGLANAQVQARKWADAKATLRKLQRTEWPARFNTVNNQTRELDRRIKSQQ
ncbi:VIT domain-containing protein [Thalassoglobus polymorphus]|uniref:Vault protein inter-alpha-trypsin n=1 Tax=Thalassoglobus polymorphus TaxID=2527994 RepID=A0A517QP55_9PLAN|nr:VIT domain-containing protein [Thalassoglobus polymorphus]QDT33419.1 Vault protein inter-alpha-trypsin [Thalassoglobus polymorphus]